MLGNPLQPIIRQILKMLVLMLQYFVGRTRIFGMVAHVVEELLRGQVLDLLPLELSKSLVLQTTNHLLHNQNQPYLANYNASQHNKKCGLKLSHNKVVTPYRIGVNPRRGVSIKVKKHCLSRLNHSKLRCLNPNQCAVPQTSQPGRSSAPGEHQGRLMIVQISEQY